MRTKERCAELAVLWIEAWNKMDLEWLRQRLVREVRRPRIVPGGGRTDGAQECRATHGQ